VPVGIGEVGELEEHRIELRKRQPFGGDPIAAPEIEERLHAELVGPDGVSPLGEPGQVTGVALRERGDDGHRNAGRPEGLDSALGGAKCPVELAE